VCIMPSATKHQVSLWSCCRRAVDAVAIELHIFEYPRLKKISESNRMNRILFFCF
jgi:hypothetical protein